MNQRIMLPVGLAIGALILGVLMIMLAVLLVRPAAAQNSVDGVPGRHVTVVGHGQVSGKPDTATVQIGVETEAPTAQEALAQNNTQAALLAAKLQELGIAEADLQTSGFNIFPVYGNDGRQVTGYRVSNSVSVTIRDIENAGTLLDEVVQAGANSVYGISFSIADPQALLDTARQQAIADAQARAAFLAQAAGVALGDVLVINENIGTAPVVPLMAVADMKQAGVPIQPGEQQLSVDLQVTFALR